MYRNPPITEQENEDESDGEEQQTGEKMQSCDGEMENIQTERRIKDHFMRCEKNIDSCSKQKLRNLIPLSRQRKGHNSQAMSVTYGSPAFKKFITHLELVNRERLGDHYICLTCWCFLDLGQQSLHQRYMHVCATVGSICSEESFLIQAETYNRFNMVNDTMQIFRKYQRSTLEKIEVIKSSGSRNQNNSLKGRKEVCQQKGCPPILKEPLAHLDMIPFNDPSLFSR